MSQVSQVPLLDLRRHGAELDAALEGAFRRVLTSGRYILGSEVDELEKSCAAYTQSAHAIGVSSGTDALVLALMTLGIGPGDEVVCPTYTFFATAGAIWRVGAKPVFCDVHPTCFNASAETIAKVVGPKTKAIIVVHLYGQSADMGPILALAKERGLHVIEDAAQALGSEYQGKRVGSLGDIGCFSFFPSKNLGALGDAGLVTTNDPELAERARILRAHGSKPKYYHQIVGGNFRIDALQAAILREKLPYLDGWTARRQANAALYTSLFEATGLTAPNACTPGCSTSCRSGGAAADAKLLLPVACQSRHIYNQYVVRVPGEGKRDALQKHLASRKVGTEIYYPVPMHLQKCFEQLGGAPGSLPVAEAAAKETLALPIFPELTEDEARYVVESVAAFFT